MSRSRVQLPPNSYGVFAASYDDIRFDRFSLSLAGYVENLIGRIGARRILELACGTGSLLARLRGPGRSVVGLDLSMEMLLEAKKKGGGSGLINASMTALPFRRSFDLVLCLYDSMNYLLEDEGLAGAFREARSLLDEEGVFLFDLNNRLAFEEVWDGGDPYRAAGRRGMVQIRSRYDSQRRIGEAEVEVEVEEGETSVVYHSIHCQRFYEASAVAAYLREAGFGSISRTPINPFPEEEEFDLLAKDLWVAAVSVGGV